MNGTRKYDNIGISIIQYTENIFNDLSDQRLFVFVGFPNAGAPTKDFGSMKFNICRSTGRQRFGKFFHLVRKPTNAGFRNRDTAQNKVFFIWILNRAGVIKIENMHRCSYRFG